MADTAFKSQSAEAPPPLDDATTSINKITSLLRAKDDTQRFVGLALLKSLLDNSPQLREDAGAVRALWRSISPKFLDRLLKTGLNPSNQDGKDMLDISVSVLHTFALLLPEERCEARFTDRVPVLVAAVVPSSPGTMELLLQLLLALVSTQQGAEALVNVDDLSPLTESAPTNSTALDILSHAWLNCMVQVERQDALRKQADQSIQNLVSTFKGTDAVTLLEFLGNFLRQADPAIIPPSPRWLKAVAGYIQNLVTSRPNQDARAAYTNAAASLLRAYPDEASSFLFIDRSDTEKPFGYLFISLLLIDIRSSTPTLIEQLNSPDHPKRARRLASAYDVISIFIGFLIRSLEDESLDALPMPPDSLLKLRKGISETMAVTAEYLRDRWDASVAGAMGLHHDARAGPTVTDMGTRHTLAWDSMKEGADDDPLVLAAVRALALWLREDENDDFRTEATGLTDMFMDLYRYSSSGEGLDFRLPVLVALEALITLSQGRKLVLEHDGWKILSGDLVNVMQGLSRAAAPAGDVARGVEIVRVLLSIAEEEGNPEEQWMGFITTAAAWGVPEGGHDHTMLEFEVAILQLCSTLLTNASPGLRARYVYSLAAIAGIAGQIELRIPKDDPLREMMDDVLVSLSSLR